MMEAAGGDRALNERVGNIARNLHAMDVAVREALLQHKRAGNSVAVWRDGQVVWVPPTEIPEELDDAPGEEA
jgi:hypothetical protein